MEEKDRLLQKLREEFPGAALDSASPPDEASLRIGREDLPRLAERLKQAPYDYAVLLDLTCVDHLREESGLEVVYLFLSLSGARRLRVKSCLPADDPSIGTLTALWKNADWLEREVFDMFGVLFAGHPDLRRLLMYDGFEGHPLRKSYPLRKEQPRLPISK